MCFCVSQHISTRWFIRPLSPALRLGVSLSADWLAVSRLGGISGVFVLLSVAPGGAAAHKAVPRAGDAFTDVQTAAAAATGAQSTEVEVEVEVGGGSGSVWVRGSLHNCSRLWSLFFLLSFLCSSHSPMSCPLLFDPFYSSLCSSSLSYLSPPLLLSAPLLSCPVLRQA